MSDKGGISWSTIAIVFLGLTMVGAPMVAYVWETLNRLLSGQFEAMRLVWSVLVAVLLWFFLRWIARYFERWQTGVEPGGRQP